MNKIQVDVDDTPIINMEEWKVAPPVDPVAAPVPEAAPSAPHPAVSVLSDIGKKLYKVLFNILNTLFVSAFLVWGVCALVSKVFDVYITGGVALLVYIVVVLCSLLKTPLFLRNKLAPVFRALRMIRIFKR